MSRTIATGVVRPSGGVFFLDVMAIKVGEAPTARSAKMTKMTARLTGTVSSVG